MGSREILSKYFQQRFKRCHPPLLLAYIVDFIDELTDEQQHHHSVALLFFVLDHHYEAIAPNRVYH